MIYYRVRPEFDNKKQYRILRGKKEYYSIFVGNELYTENELCKKKIIGWRQYCEPVEVSKRNIYYFFGARFEVGVPV